MKETWLQALQEHMRKDSDSYVQSLVNWSEPSSSNLLKTKALKDIFKRRASYPPDRKLHISGYETLMPKLNAVSTEDVRQTSFDSPEFIVLFFSVPESNEFIGRLKLDLLQLAKMKEARGSDFYADDIPG